MAIVLKLGTAAVFFAAGIFMLATAIIAVRTELRCDADHTPEDSVINAVIMASSLASMLADLWVFWMLLA